MVNGAVEVAAGAGGGRDAGAPRSDRALPAIAILAAFGLAFAWLANAVLEDRGAFDHDEVITHLAVSGHLDDWQGIEAGQPPAGTWVPAQTYRDVLDMDDASSPGEVQQQLADLDLHPPLYFWGVYAARESGIGLFRSGPAVNVVAGWATIAVLFLLLRRVFDRQWVAALATGLFAFSAAVVFAGSLARPYVLLALAITALNWVTARLLRAPSAWPYLLALVAATALGLLTAYPFAFALAGAMLVLLVRGVTRRSVPDTLLPIAAAAAGTVVFVLVHPGYRTQLDRADFASPGYVASEALDRARTTFEGLSDIVTLESWGDDLVTPFLALVLVAALVISPWWAARALRHSPEVAAASSILVVSLLLTTAAYVAGRIPPHSTGRHYVAMFVPPLVVVVCALLARLPRPEIFVGVAVALVALSTLHWESAYESIWGHQRQSVAATRSARAFVADCSSRGYLPGVMMWSHPESEVLLLPRATDPPPAPPVDLQRDDLLFLHNEPAACSVPSGIPGQQVLEELGVRPTGRVGYVGKVEVISTERDGLAPDDDEAADG
jgi:hypothetical protein